MPLDVDIFGQGIYSPRQAARLIGGTPQEVLRWTRGSGPNGPLWNGHYQILDDSTEVSFTDLIELRMVRAFRKAGISLQAIRFAISYAKEKLGVEYPLSSLGFKTDGTEILIEALELDGELMSLSKKRVGQKVFSRLIDQSLNDLEYENEKVTAWRPSQAKFVILDPDRSFGKPILEEFGISTSILNAEALSGYTPQYLSKLYEIPLKLVNDALRFEKNLDKQQKG